jgi:hypothetical protein
MWGTSSRAGLVTSTQCQDYAVHRRQARVHSTILWAT